MGASRIAVVGVVMAALVAVAQPADAQDTPTCFGEVATIVAEADSVTVGTGGDDVIVGTPGPDVIRAQGGDDLICGLGGSDVIYGNGGRDSIHGGAGADSIYGGLQGDYLVGGGGPDKIRGQAGPDEVRGLVGDDIIRGGAGDDQLLGGSGNDNLWGRSGDDVLRGGTGYDSCVAGLGEDVLLSCNEAPPRPSRVYAFGDSIMVGVGTQYCDVLQAAVPGVIEDAAVSRQFTAALALVSSAVAGGVPDDTVFVIALGTNGPITASAFDALFTVDDSSRFLFVNVKVPRSWEAGVNDAIRAGVNRHRDRAALVDWHAVASANPHYLAADGIHVTCAGAAAFASAIADGLEQLPSI